MIVKLFSLTPQRVSYAILERSFFSPSPWFRTLFSFFTYFCLSFPYLLVGKINFRFDSHRAVKVDSQLKFTWLALFRGSYSKGITTVLVKEKERENEKTRREKDSEKERLLLTFRFRPRTFYERAESRVHTRAGAGVRALWISSLLGAHPRYVFVRRATARAFLPGAYVLVRFRFKSSHFLPLSPLSCSPTYLFLCPRTRHGVPKYIWNTQRIFEIELFQNALINNRYLNLKKSFSSISNGASLMILERVYIHEAILIRGVYEVLLERTNASIHWRLVIGRRSWDQNHCGVVPGIDAAGVNAEGVRRTSDVGKEEMERMGSSGRFLARPFFRDKGTAAIHYEPRMTPQEIYRLTTSANWIECRPAKTPMSKIEHCDRCWTRQNLLVNELR